jgi:hypothetical protein
MFAALEFWDLFWIWLIITVFWGGSTVYANFKPKDRARLRRLEAKVDLILEKLKLEYQPPPGALSEKVRALADDPATKIEAIKQYRLETGAGLAEAKEVVETYLAERG